MTDMLLSVTGLTMRFGGLTAVNGLDFTAQRGDITAVIGPNGAGKTTVFNCITGFYKPTSGSITIAHAPGQALRLDKMAGHAIAKKGRVARTFQNIRLFKGMSVLENLLVAQHNRLQAATGFGVLGVLGLGRYRAAEQEAIERAKYWLEATHLLERADDAAGSLPYGAQRRLEIARAMCTDPVLLCLDEPAAGLNPRESAALNELLLNIRAQGCSLLLIEHDMGVVMKISDHIVVLDHGKKIADGTGVEIRHDQAVISAYLGEGDEDDADAPIARRRGGRPMTQPLLSLRGVNTFYGPIQALRDVDLDVHEGEIVTLIGANGAGKSTLMMTICGNPSAKSGTILYRGEDITELPTHQIARRAIAQSPEGRRIFPRMSVEENLLMGSQVVKFADYDRQLALIFILFPRLKERFSQRGGTLSGGEQQMLAIARALMSKPRLLLLDEPSLGLAPLVIKQIFAAIRKLNQETGLTVLLVEQNANQALRLAHRGYVLVNGAITMAGTGAELLARPEIRAAYLEGAH